MAAASRRALALALLGSLLPCGFCFSCDSAHGGDDWTAAQQEHCCVHDAGCHIEGETMTCTKQVARLAGGASGHACSKAQTMVADRCPQCAHCKHLDEDCSGKSSSRADSSAKTHEAAHETSSRTTVAPSDLSYDCHAGEARWKTGWSKQKKEWCCCKWSAVGAFASCADAAPTAEDRKRVCAAYTFKTTTTGRSTTSQPFDCQHDAANVGAWHPSKKEWCCLHEGVACPHIATSSRPYDCMPGSEDEWPEAHRQWCCNFAGRGCPPTTTVAHKESTEYDCDPTVTNLVQYWDDAKREWCCSHHSRGCDKHHFDCRAGVARWKDGWSHAKKAWCCDHHQIGCEQSLPVFDCSGSLSAWTAKKKDYCCKEENIGCATTATTTEKPLFDCQAGLARAASGWSELKLDWCCQHEDLGCQTTTTEPIASAQLPFNCDEGYAEWKTGWSETKSAYCCRVVEVGCPEPTTTLPEVLAGLPANVHFDCTADSQNWQNSWSSVKAAWCCYHEGRGCSSSEDEAPTSSPIPWSASGAGDYSYNTQGDAMLGDATLGDATAAAPTGDATSGDATAAMPTLGDSTLAAGDMTLGQAAPALAASAAPVVDTTTAATTTEEQDGKWEVVFAGSVRVRDEKSTTAHVISMKDHGFIVRGRKEGKWLALSGEPGYMLMETDDGQTLVVKLDEALPFSEQKYQRHQQVGAMRASFLGPDGVLIAMGVVLSVFAAAAGLRAGRAAISGPAFRRSDVEAADTVEGLLHDPPLTPHPPVVGSTEAAPEA